MAEINLEWGRCFRELLERHGLSYRGAMMKAGGVVSHTTIKDWADGIVPRDHRKAWAFFAVFPTEEAAVCHIGHLSVRAFRADVSVKLVARSVGQNFRSVGWGC